jgi:hypothetical protein
MRSNSVLARSDIPLILLQSIIGKTYAEIASDFDVGKSTIGDVVKGRTWKEVARPKQVKNTDFYSCDDGRVFNIRNNSISRSKVMRDKQTDKKYVTRSVKGKKEKLFI